MMMKKMTSATLALLFAVATFFPAKAQAKHHSGNYINEDGCLVVWSYDTAVFGLIKYNEQEDIFCDVVLEP